MKHLPYSRFSRQSRRRTVGGPDSCHFEITYRCPLRCTHCQSACFTSAPGLRGEISTRQAMLILDKLRDAGVLWLSFSGGDPLSRPDFPEIYEHAKDNGFIITVFTSAYCVQPRLLRLFGSQPPFQVETTINAASARLHAKLSGVPDALAKIKRNLRLLRKLGIPLKIKTQLMSGNAKELPRLKHLAAGLGARFQVSSELNPRLDGDKTPCALRLPPEAYGRLLSGQRRRAASPRRGKAAQSPFFCAALSGRGIGVDPYGNLFLCELIRTAKHSLLRLGVDSAAAKAAGFLDGIKFGADSKCGSCPSFGKCGSCPGQAYLESGDGTAHIDYYCRAAGRYP